MGVYRPGFGVKEVSVKLFDIYEKHTNDKGLWIKDPRLTKVDEETKITKSQFKNSQKKTVRETIELLCMAGFPRQKMGGTLTAKTIANVGGISESVINDFNGYLIEPKNKKQLLEAIILISSDEEKRINFSNNTLSVLLNNHQIEVNCKKILDIFKIKLPPCSISCPFSLLTKFNLSVSRKLCVEY